MDRDTAELLERFREIVNNAVESQRPVTFLTLGRTGVGKSSTINSLVGERVAATNAYRPETMGITRYDLTHQGARYVVIDTPGLCDDLPEAGRDEVYLKMIVDEVVTFDLLLYVTPLSDRRLGSDEKRGIKLLTSALGANCWRNAVVVFTHADQVAEADFEATVNARAGIVRQEIAQYSPEAGLIVPVVSISNVRETLPDGTRWLGEFFTVAVRQLAGNAKIKFFLSQSNDIKPAGNEPPRVALSDRQRKVLANDIRDTILEAAGAGAIIGASLGVRFGGPWGAAVGGTIGGAIGGLFGWLTA